MDDLMLCSLFTSSASAVRDAGGAPSCRAVCLRCLGPLGRAGVRVPFNIVIVLYLLCTGPDNPYYPHRPATPAGALEHNATELNAAQLLEGILLGVGQIYACGALGPSFLILGAVLLYSPLQALHAVLGSAAGALAVSTEH
ncbi:LOW QUALITY PROTEIN: hypothetical protein CRUP_009113 [Coryphaenoides rupestris]|nr:LOW QUALITY PROTEIN: hypothetical protein CRUP_009113 [Coryphaenoides rupestris]